MYRLGRWFMPVSWCARRQLAQRLGAAGGLALLLLLSLPAQAQDVNGVCRVTTGGSSGNSGATWAAPMALQTALTTPGCTEVWVAKGTYQPTSGTDRKIIFKVRPGVAVYGGFAGNETSRGQRGQSGNASILSGDIGVAGDASDNSYHVVVMDGTTGAGNILADTVLDGFTITAGQADFLNGRNGNLDVSGGGLLCDGSGAGNVCSPTLSHLTFTGNYADTYGGAMALLALRGTASPTLTNITFVDNTSGSVGGAMFIHSQAGGVGNPQLTNVTFMNNHADYGAAMFVIAYQGTGKPLLTNVIAWGSGGGIGTIFNDYSNVIINDSIIAGGCPTSSTGGSTCSNVSSADPQLGPLQANGGSAPTALPGPGSAAIDAIACSNAPATDQRGVARPQGPQCDYGAVEVRQAMLTVNVTSAHGAVTGPATPAPNGAAINGCTQTGGSCSAWYSLEPSAPIVALSLTPDAGYRVASVTGCGGSLSGTNYTTATLAGSCTVQVAFTLDTHTLTYSAGAHGSLSGDTTQTVSAGGSGTPVTAGADAHYHFTQWSDGLTANPRTDTNVTADINVSAAFAIDQYTVTAAVNGGHGSIAPASQAVAWGTPASFTITPDAGSRIASVNGCGGAVSGTSYTTAPVSSPCTVTVTFAIALPPPTPVPALDWRGLLALLGLLAAVAAIGLPRKSV